mgnify:FL=1
MRVARSCGMLAAVLLMATGVAMAGEPGQPAPAQAASVEDGALLRVEIPAGSFTKYEIDADGQVHVDRFLPMPVVYPANYGAMPGTLAGDGDPLDALVFTRAPLHPGVLIRFRPIGVLRMHDGGEEDDKIIGVPTDAVDPHYVAVRDIGDLSWIDRQRLETFFRVYKGLPDDAAGSPVQLNGFGNAAEAQALIRSSLVSPIR